VLVVSACDGHNPLAAFGKQAADGLRDPTRAGDANRDLIRGRHVSPILSHASS
jgi:hypothetical protein